MNYPEFVAHLAKPLPTKEQRTIHAFLGMVGEVGELVDTWKKHLIYEQKLDKKNLKEEFGDFAFYLQALMNEHNLDITTEYPKRIYKASTDISQTLFSLLNNITTFQTTLRLGKADTFTIDQGFQSIEYPFISLLLAFGFSLDKILKENMAKLNKRYPNGYSNENAKLRLDKQ